MLMHMRFVCFVEYFPVLCVPAWLYCLRKHKIIYMHVRRRQGGRQALDICHIRQASTFFHVN